MTDTTPKCAALTKSGSPCRNYAQHDSDYCHIHQGYQADVAPAVSENDAELRALIAELNQLAAELQRAVPEYTPPPYTPSGMLGLLKTNAGRFTPEAVRSLQDTLEGTSIDDFRDIETWKGMWFTLNYLVQMEANERTVGLRQRLRRLPGVNTISDLQVMLADTPKEEFLKVDTWKGMWFIANYELQNQAQGMKKRLLGSDNEEETA
ncbi:MAG: hypothetical protein J5I90_20355 [Caldilineales bacterium]|nr:hypothetical protein [Caldilineales bacterium]